MASRKELFEHEEKLWVLCVGQESLAKKFTPLVDLIDWYNNQLLAKSVLKGGLTLKAGEATLLSTTGLLPVSRLLIFGLGEGKNMGVAQARTLSQDLGQVLEGLKAPPPWIIISEDASPKFVDEFQKSRTSSEALSRASISVG